MTAYAVNRRKKEIAIRMALGADHRKVILFVLRHTIVLAGIGLTLGLSIATAGSRLLESCLFGMKGIDVLTFGAVFWLFATVTTIANYVPARRASGVDPMVALRSE